VESVVSSSLPNKLQDSYRGKRVFVTGHTGFKGSWLVQWLLSLGAKVTGYSLQPPTDPSLFVQLQLAQRVTHIEADILDSVRLMREVTAAEPDILFHLAAQSLVRYSYNHPRETYEVNVIGTVNVLEALRGLEKRCAVVIVTSDKCYENREWIYGYREEDLLGGHDPYSSSKAAAELVTATYRNSFFKDSPVAIASARAGNVIGGGDWAEDRIMPDCIRYLSCGESIPIRNRAATRPWQHVLEPLSGYLELAAAMIDQSSDAKLRLLTSAFNFGPALESNRSVGDLVTRVLAEWPGNAHDKVSPDAPHEAGRLNLATDKAFHLLGWAPTWSFAEAVTKTVKWYKEASQCKEDSTAVLKHLTKNQISEFECARAQKQSETNR
jgi:CDP-glucose 4,6-dehydratase